jgi:hypothetical protein
LVGAWGGHPPSGVVVVRGGPRATWRCHWLCRADVPPWLGLGPHFPGGFPRRLAAITGFYQPDSTFAFCFCFCCLFLAGGIERKKNQKHFAKQFCKNKIWQTRCDGLKRYLLLLLT